MEETTFEVVEADEPTVKVSRENTYTQKQLLEKRATVYGKLQLEKRLVDNLEAELKTVDDAIDAILAEAK